MQQEKFEQVRELMEQQEYEQALALLNTIDHPLAEKWQQRIAQADPKALVILTEREQQRQQHFQEWLVKEQKVAQLTGAALVIFAGYIWLFESVLWAFSPEILVRTLPLLIFAAGVYVLWNGQNTKRLQAQIARMDAAELRKISAILIPSAGLLALLTLFMGNFAQFFMAGFMVALGMLNVWRATQADELHR